MKYIEKQRSRGEVNKPFNSPALTNGKHNRYYKTKAGISIMINKGLNSGNSSCIMLNRKAVWSEYIESIPFNWFATFTTGYEMTINGARRLMDRYHKALKIEGQENLMFWVAEKFQLKDGYHLHALIKTDLPWNQENLWLLWQDKSVYAGQVSTRKDGKVYNRADIRKRNFNKKAGLYLCKYLTKSASDFDFLI